jgi:hypothetical protein
LRAATASSTRRAALALLAGALAIGTAGAAIALAAGTLQTQRAHAGAISAVFSFRYDRHDVVSPYTGLHLTITRDGQTLHDAAVHSALCDSFCMPAGTGSVAVADVEGDGEPDVLLNLYSGGAHCCYVVQVFRYDPTTHGYATLDHIWGDPSYELEHLDPGPALEFVSADDRFAYEFAAYAFSGLPLEILRLHGGRFIDVTRSFPKLVGADAAGWWKSYRAGVKGEFGLGFLAAWAADEYNLGHSATVSQTLTRLQRAGELRSSPGFGPGGAGFVAHLDRFLKQEGYTE